MISEAKSAWRLKNKAKLASANKKYRQANRGKEAERKRRWTETHRAEVNAASNAWAKAHVEVVRKRNLAWKRANAEKANASSRAWQRNNPEKFNAKSRAWKQSKNEKIAGCAKPSKCDVCGSSSTKICFDHCHASNNFRGWVCTNCNFILGHAHDQEKLLIKLAAYLAWNRRVWTKKRRSNATTTR